MVDKKVHEASKVIKATFRNNPKDWRNIYPASVAILLISPGQPYYQGDKLAAIVEAINRYGFKECHIMMGDVNYRHTLRVLSSEPEEVLQRQAREIGTKWLEENEYIYRNLNNYKVFRWENWLFHPQYVFYRQKLDDIYEHDQTFKETFLSSALEFMARQVHPPSIEINEQHAINCCLEYLKEECTIIMPLWAEMGYRVIIYPNKMLTAMEATYNALVLPHNLCHWLSLRFEKKTASDFNNHEHVIDSIYAEIS